MDPRRSPRFRTRFEVLISADPAQGSGVLTEISYAGARLEETSIRLPVASRVTLYVFVRPVAPFTLSGQVVRSTEGGFAITYELFDPEVRRLVDDVSAMVDSPPAA